MNKRLTFSKVAVDDITEEISIDEVKVATTDPDVSNEVHKLLQRQVNHEFSNERLYLSMALWCEENGYPETAKFFSSHAVEEERVHGMKVINYMLKKKIKVLTPVPEESKREYTNMKEVLEDAIKREKMTSKMIGEILSESIKQGDLAYTIASELMNEQIEEEQLFNSLLNLFEMCNNSRVDFEMEINTLKASGKYKIGNL